MLRLKVLACAIPLLVVALFARQALLPGAHPCISVGDKSVEIATLPWRAELHVSFTDDPALATVRVQLSETADAADFVLIDDLDGADVGACHANSPVTLVSISAGRSDNAPVIYLSAEGPADYRIFVNSSSFTARETAALIVGANGGRNRQIAASL